MIDKVPSFLLGRWKGAGVPAMPPSRTTWNWPFPKCRQAGLQAAGSQRFWILRDCLWASSHFTRRKATWFEGLHPCIFSYGRVTDFFLKAMELTKTPLTWSIPILSWLSIVGSTACPEEIALGDPLKLRALGLGRVLNYSFLYLDFTLLNTLVKTWLFLQLYSMYPV